MSLSSFLAYLQYEKRFSQHTLTAYRADLDQFADYLSRMYGEEDLSRASSVHIRSWLVSQLAGGKTVRTVRRKASALRSYYRFLRKRGGLQRDPMQKVQTGKLPRSLPGVVRQDDLRAMLEEGGFEDSFAGKRDRLVLELLYGTGMRRAELLALKPSDVDREGRQLRVLGKGGKERLLPLGEWLLPHLEAYLNARSREFGPCPERPLLLTDKGRPLYPKKVYLIAKHYLSTIPRAEGRSPHVLRHSFATHLMERGANLQALKELLGHASLAATQVYTHNTVEQLKKSYAQAHPKARKKSGE